MSRKKANRATRRNALSRQAQSRTGNLLQGSKPVRLSPVKQLRQTIGNQAMYRMIQAQSFVNQPGDPAEQQADQLAEAVLRMPDEAPYLQRQPVGEGEEDLFRQPEEDNDKLLKEETEEGMLSAKANAGNSPTVTPSVQSNISQLRGGGQPLSQPEREFFEPRFGKDFRQVRLHTDQKAADTARAVNAKAFTTGQDVVFGSGQYAPQTSEGKKLLGHELAHVVQQKHGLVQRKAHYKTQLENTFKRAPYRDPKTNEIKYHVDKTDMCNVTTLAMQLITLTGDEIKLKEAVKDLLAEKKFPTPRPQLETMTLADLIATLIYHKKRKPEEWKERLKVVFPHMRWKGFRKLKGDLILRGEALIMVGLEILEKIGIEGKGERIAGEKIADKISAGKESAQKFFEETLQPKLEAGGVIMLSTILPGGGHYVYLNSVVKGSNGGVIIDDPYGMKLRRYLKYGANFTPGIMNQRRKIHQLLKHRIQYNPALWNVLQKLEKGDKFPEYIGERNYYSWAEVSRYHIGRSVNILNIGKSS